MFYKIVSLVKHHIMRSVICLLGICNSLGLSAMPILVCMYFIAVVIIWFILSLQVYKVVVVCKGRQWFIFRRYSEFENLYTKVIYLVYVWNKDISKYSYWKWSSAEHGVDSSKHFFKLLTSCDVHWLSSVHVYGWLRFSFIKYNDGHSFHVITYKLHWVPLYISIFCMPKIFFHSYLAAQEAISWCWVEVAW